MLALFFSTTFVRVYGLLGNLLILFGAVALLGIEARGEIALCLTWAALMQAFFYFSLGQIAYKLVLDYPSKKNQVVSSLIIYNIICIPVILVVFYVIYFWLIPENTVSFTYFILAGIAVPFLILEQHFYSLHLAHSPLVWINKISFTTKSVGFLLIAGSSFWLNLGVFGYLAAFLVSAVLSATYYLFTYCKQHVTSWDFSLSYLAKMMRSAVSLHTSSLGYALYTNSSILILPWFSSKEAIAAMEMAMKFMNLFLVQAHAVQSMSMSYFANNNFADAYKKYKKMLIFMAPLLLVLSGGAYVMAPLAIEILMGEKHGGLVTIVFRSIVFLSLPMACGVVAMALFINLKWYMACSSYNLTIGLVSVLSNYFLIAKYQLMGAIWATQITYSLMGLMFFLLMFIIQRRVDVQRFT